MTGFGRAATCVEHHSISLEVSSVNGKKADFYISAAKEYSFCESAIRAVLQKRFDRGKVVVKIFSESGNSDSEQQFEEKKIKKGLAALEKAALANNIPYQPTLEHILDLARILRDENVSVEQDLLQASILEALDQALDAHTSMRVDEGAILKADINQQLETMIAATNKIAELAKEEPRNYREKLLNRLAEAGLELELEDERVLKEIALFADRCDVSEELSRLDSHYQQFKSFLQETGSIGRKLDFLCQEMNRECNTIGSKTKNIEITKLVIAKKAALECIREQVANAE